MKLVVTLASVCAIQITIDTSPPHPGYVHDGFEGQPEVDFQQTLTLSAHWSGFFDKESGVWFYMYGFAEKCLTGEVLQPDSVAPGVISL